MKPRIFPITILLCMLMCASCSDNKGDDSVVAVNAQHLSGRIETQTFCANGYMYLACINRGYSGGVGVTQMFEYDYDRGLVPVRCQKQPKKE